MALVAFTVLAAATGFATPYRTPEQIAAEYLRSGVAFEPRMEFFAPRGRNALDQRAYFLQYRMLCDFLVRLQYTGGGPDQGGMREGESGSDYTIIQTDNTQEAIRVWSQYGIWTGDTGRYAANIRLAWGYCQRFPAWEEEGGGYYAAHNCGWGFEAERKFRQAYGDTSMLWYADSCATWVAANPLPFDPNSTGLGQLEPLAQGLAIGGMYPHAVFRGRQDWQNFCLLQARRLRRWFESNPNRLHANEVWALCGGTALWGVCKSLFSLYPDSGRMWLGQYGRLLDVWQSAGTWNHAFNTWYCNAHNACFVVTRNDTFWNNAVFITDSLIGLDTDHDGGIPPGYSYPVTNDHSWVSAYMGWMGMEAIIDSLPATDVAAVGFVSPNATRPYLAGDSLFVAARVISHSLETLPVRVRVTGSGYADSVLVSLSPGADTIVAMNRRWVVPDSPTLPPRSPLRLQTVCAADQNPRNDTLTTAFDIRRQVHVEGSILAEQNPQYRFSVRIEFVHEGYPDSLWTVVEQSNDSLYRNGPRPLMAGRNTIRVIPDPAGLMIGVQTRELSPGPPQVVNFALPNSEIVLVDDDGGARYETYLLASLDSLNNRVRYWDNLVRPPHSFGSSSIVWFTGDDSVRALEPSEQVLLSTYLAGGGHLLLTGQNITDQLGPDSWFLTTVLSCSARANNTNARHVVGIAGDPIGGGLDCYLIGSGGAQNQSSPSSVTVLPGASGVLRYTGTSTDVCGVRGTYEEGRFVFLSFGLEAVSGINRSTTRRQILERCFRWFGDSLSVDETTPPVPLQITLAPNYPNPFNTGTTFTFTVPRGVEQVSLIIYNTLGQEVRRLFEGRGSGNVTVVWWDGTTRDGARAASGVYVCRLRAGNRQQTRLVHLLR